jgi:hypothetical protein
MADPEIQNFFDYAKQEIMNGGDYRTRIRSSPLYRKLAMSYDNLDEVVDRAEKKIPLDAWARNWTRLGWLELLRGRRSLQQLDETGIPRLEDAEIEAQRVFISVCVYAGTVKNRYDENYGKDAMETLVKSFVKAEMCKMYADKTKEDRDQEVYDLTKATIEFRKKLGEATTEIAVADEMKRSNPGLIKRFINECGGDAPLFKLIRELQQ